MIVGKFFAVILIGYFLGAIPFGLLVTRITRGLDIREYGSSNTGVANVVRTVGKAAGLLVFIADVGKGAGAALIAWAIFGSGAALLYTAMAVAALAAMIGHNWSVYIKFRGGRGVTVGAGGLLAMYWPVGLGCLVVFAIVTAVSRYVSLGSIMASSSSIVFAIPVVVLKVRPIEFLIYGAVGTSIIVFRHRANIKRLISGTERKIGEKAKKREGVAR